MSFAPRGSHEDEFLTLLPLVDRVIAFVARRHHLATAEAEEFAAHVKLKLVENDYAVLRKFQGRSSMQSFLTTVISRLSLDLRNDEWGKWRPSAEARRSGPVAVLLERLLMRDGHTFDEACEIVITNHGVHIDRRELAQLAERLPERQRRRFEPLERASGIVASGARADTAVSDLEQRQVSERVMAALRTVMDRLDGQDRVILALRFEDGRKLVEIARMLHLAQKPLYTRVDRLLRQLRAALEAEGVDANSVSNVFTDQH